MRQKFHKVWNSLVGYRCKKCGRRAIVFQGNIRCSICDKKLLDEEIAAYL